MSDLEARLTPPVIDAEAVETMKRRLIESADEDGLVDVAFAPVDSPIGTLIAAGTRHGLVRLSFDSEDADDVLEELATRISPRILEAPARLDEVRRELDEYFDGQRNRFELEIDWNLASGDFSRKVLRAARRIPFGSVTTYSDMARRAGSPRAARAAGNALGSNPIPIVVPCHRVVHSGGGLGGYGGGLDKKKFLLTLEGALEDDAER
jgi:methylated-DNA-[protein]-cysteine S-methyltransferase